jgi:hypothetical protein
MAKRSILRIILSGVFGLLIFILLFYGAGYLTKYITNYVYMDFVGFLDKNFILILTMILIGMLSEIFWAFYFPFTLIAPIISAISSFFIITLLYRLWIFLNTYIKLKFSIPIELIYVIVFLIVLIVGYIAVFARMGKKEKEEPKEKQKERVEKVKWSEVGEEFKMAMFNLARTINNSLEKKNKKKAGKKGRKK